ncbi:LptE family protein [uncultured Paludibaculum sp.]|uniref:LptE family protein n=1 Tax=uncultured Paludibaculum sp. TaxID=1765020 RepID=UPI002AAA6F52|nr:LptE family protein [uncultured Paludibaculum sp.]
MRFAALVLAAFSLVGCGYHVGGHGDMLPSTLRTIAIPAFGNNTTRYKLTEQLPGAIGREFISRTRYQVVTNLDTADAVLSGAVVNFYTAPTIFDQKTGRAAGIQVSVFMNISLKERKTGKVLYSRENMEVRQRYEVATDQLQYFDESTVALQRLSQEVARQVVSSVLEAF